MFMVLMAMPRILLRGFVAAVVGLGSWVVAGVRAVCADVYWDFTSNRLTLKGDWDPVNENFNDTGPDLIKVHCDSATGKVSLERNDGGSGTISVNCTDVYEIYVEGLRGDDTLDLQSVEYNGSFDNVSIATILGGKENDNIVGAGSAPDHIEGGEGNDSCIGVGGNDTILGGPGNDSLEGNTGDDSVYGQGDDDWIWGNAGDDTLHGDDPTGGNGEDCVSGGTGHDSIAGGGNETGEIDKLYHGDFLPAIEANNPDGGRDSIWGGNFGQASSEEIYYNKSELDWKNGVDPED